MRSPGRGEQLLAVQHSSGQFSARNRGAKLKPLTMTIPGRQVVEPLKLRLQDQPFVRQAATEVFRLAYRDQGANHEYSVTVSEEPDNESLSVSVAATGKPAPNTVPVQQPPAPSEEEAAAMRRAFERRTRRC